MLTSFPSACRRLERHGPHRQQRSCRERRSRDWFRIGIGYGISLFPHRFHGVHFILLHVGNREFSHFGEYAWLGLIGSRRAPGRGMALQGDDSGSVREVLQPEQGPIDIRTLHFHGLPPVVNAIVVTSPWPSRSRAWQRQVQRTCMASRSNWRSGIDPGRACPGQHRLRRLAACSQIQCCPGLRSAVWIIRRDVGELSRAVCTRRCGRSAQRK